MKPIIFLSILFCALTMPAFAELTDADLDKIRLIVKEEVTKEVTDSETRIKEYINLKNESVEKRLTMVTNLVYALIGCIGIPLVVLTVLIAWRSLKDNSQNKTIEESRPRLTVNTRLNETTAP